ncbi:DUF885 domain-containing protein [uncultured Eubacterium sp.]|uniref:DUF885 domain-containing protein n=1 Tax=uncultured Eubacterium sp. TaxID=165185 RepID=UPI003267BD00
MHFYIANTNEFFQTDFPQSLGTFSLKDMKNSQSDYIKQINTLQKFDYKSLSKSQQITYDILLSHFRTELDFGDLCEYYDCLSPTTGIQAQLPILLSEYEFYSEKDIKNYLLLLKSIPDFFDSIINFESEKIDNKTFMSKSNCESIIAQCLSLINDGSNKDNLLIETFNSRLKKCKFLSDKVAADYLNLNKDYVNNYVLSSYKKLTDKLSHFNSSYYTDKDLENYTLADSKQGKAYYEYLVSSKTGSTKTVSELKTRIQSQIASDMTQVSSLFTSNPELESQFYNSTSTTITEPADILTDLKNKINNPDSSFYEICKLDSIKYDLKYVEPSLQDYLSPAFYLSPPIDMPDKNTIYVNKSDKFKNQDLYTTLAHEGFPGHLYQNHVFSTTNPSAIRYLLSFGGYTEGWATYAEFLSYSYEVADPSLAKALSCSASFSLGLYSLVDIGVNYEGWTPEDTGAFLKHYGFSQPDIQTEIYNSVTESPANYLQYYVGYLEITELKNLYLQNHSQKNALRDFHSFILKFGPAPFDVIQKWMK